ncbi:MAG: glycosyltransferase [Dialister hominis]|uniref:glycosyltransferase n=1 Tax=Dialister hominis TaxID=2582419 RepID=UPI002EBD6997|nr:glycosyltransferase [Dialister hominis]
MKYEDRIDAELEFCFIDDGSTDRTIEILRDLHKKDSRVHYGFFFQKLRERSRALCRAFYG